MDGDVVSRDRPPSRIPAEAGWHPAPVLRPPAALDLAGRAAFVTGARRGVGRSIATALAAQGATVAVHHAGSPDEASTRARCSPPSAIWAGAASRLRPTSRAQARARGLRLTRWPPWARWACSCALEPPLLPLDQTRIDAEQLRHLLWSGHHEKACEALGRIASWAKDAIALNEPGVAAKARRLAARCTELCSSGTGKVEAGSSGQPRTGAAGGGEGAAVLGRSQGGFSTKLSDRSGR